VPKPEHFVGQEWLCHCCGFCCQVGRLSPQARTRQVGSTLCPTCYCLRSRESVVPTILNSKFFCAAAARNGDCAQTTPVRNNFYSNQSLAGLPDVLLRKIIGFLQSKEKISSSAVSRRWHTLAYQSVNFVRFQADDDGFGAKPNQALLFGARNFHFIQKVSLNMSTFLRADGEPSSYTIGLLLDNFFRSVPKLQGACLDFQNCRSVDIESITAVKRETQL
jgi:hypothetical protein